MEYDTFGNPIVPVPNLTIDQGAQPSTLARFDPMTGLPLDAPEPEIVPEVDAVDVRLTNIERDIEEIKRRVGL